MNLKTFLRPGKGASDITPLLNDKDAFHFLIDALCKPFQDIPIDKVVAIEGRGFMLGSAVAYKLHVGFVPIRSPYKLKNETFFQSFIDYSGKEKELHIHNDSIAKNERVLIVDDWIETGATVKTTIALVEKCNGMIVGISAFIDDSNVELKKFLQPYNYYFVEQVKNEDTF